LIATKIYENLYNTKVAEFGLILYQNDTSDLEHINFMGASPDGISTCITLDGNPNPLVGRMLEIKCPLKRKIETIGQIDGGICPHYYWVQVQIQLACCKYEECDFWQCDIKEYTDDDWLLDNTEDPVICKSTCEQNIDVNISSRLTKGCIIQLLPKDTSKIPKNDRIEWYAKYIYPSNINMTDKEYLNWTTYIKDFWQRLYPQYDGYYYDRILYWKLVSCHNVLIKRDIGWFNSKLPLFKDFWQEVLYLRQNREEGLKKLEEWHSKKKIYKKKEVISNLKSIDTSGLDFIEDSPIKNQNQMNQNQKNQNQKITKKQKLLND